MNPNYLNNKQAGNVPPIVAQTSPSQIPAVPPLEDDDNSLAYKDMNFAQKAGHNANLALDVPGRMLDAALIPHKMIGRSIADVARDVSSGFTGTPSTADYSNNLPWQDKDDTTIVPGSAEDNGLNDKSSVSETGVVTNAKGETVDVPPEDVLGIFDKASSLFGDVFSAQELKRMALYTAGGLVSGGSTSGSFKWAATQVMGESAATKKNAATMAGARAKSKPVQIKVAGKNNPVQALWDGSEYYDPKTGESIANAKKWNSDKHSPEGLQKTYKGLVEGLKSGRVNKDGTQLKIGEAGILSYTKFRAKVAQWEAQGYSPDLSDPVLQSSFVEAVKASIAANKGKDFDNDDLSTPESFFDMLLVRGVVSSSAGSEAIFKDSKGGELSVASNNELMLIINNAVQTGQSAGYNSTVASATFNIHEAWMKLSPEEKKQYNNSAEKGASGFLVFAKALNDNTA